MSEQGFESLKVWQKAHELMLDVHTKLLPLLPKEEKYDLANQIQRSSKSVGANIAEGYGRFYYMDNVRFCYNARGSLDETINHLRTSLDLKYCSKDIYLQLRAKADETRRMLNGYIDWLKAQKAGEKDPGANIHIRELPGEYLIEPTREP
ncbi:MAG: four helix bundle protein [Chloroflexi bacterium]|nr:MAG: four helix bundle protein [Chloroflexota bacterium]